MTTLTFAQPEFLFLLIALPMLIVTHIYLFRFTKRKGMHFSNFDTLKRVTGKNAITRNILLLIIRLFTFALIVVALAQPVYFYEGQARTTDYVIVIDASGTMTTTDLGPMRFEVAKDLAIDFVDTLDNANVGLVSYAGLVTIHHTPTTDLEAVKQSIREMQLQRLSGTDLASAMITSSNLLLASEEGKAVVFFTDGGLTVSGFATNPLMRGTAYAVENRVVVHTVGIGRDQETLVGFLPETYNLTAQYNEDNLRYMAEQTGGEYIHVPTLDVAPAAINRLSAESQSKLLERQLSFSLIIIALVLLFIEWGLINTRFRIIP